MIRDFIRAGVNFYFGDRYRVPLHTIAWRLIWYIPIQVTRCFLVGLIAVGYGPNVAVHAWDRLR